MKKAILSIGLMVCVAVGASAQTSVTPDPTNPNAPKFKFESEVVDYGTIEHNSDPYREFTFVNSGKEPLIISGAKGSCGCTTPEWPKEPIMPGDTAVIKVKYATDRIGKFEKTITLTSNAETPSKVIRIKGVVKPDPKPVATDSTATTTTTTATPAATTTATTTATPAKR